jgi:hypothetical protein
VELGADFRSRFLDSQLYHSRKRLRVLSDFPRKGDDMGCLGVHFALTETEVNKLTTLSGNTKRLEFLQEQIEETYFGEQQEFMCETDKAWDAIHRALTDGKLACDNGEYPLNHVILGGEPLYSDDDYIMSLTTPEQVQAVASGLDDVTEQDFRTAYFRIDESEYGLPVNDEDFSYTWHWFNKLREFYRRAAQESRFVLFTADQ